MGITVKHDGNMGQLAALGFTGGYNQGRRERYLQDTTHEFQRRELALAKDRLKQQDHQFKTELAYRGQQAQLGRAHALESQNLASELRQQDAAFQDELRRGNIEYGYTAKQKQEYERYANALQQLDASTDFAPEEKMQMRRQLQGKMLGIQQVPQLREPSPYPPGQGIGEEFTSRDGLVRLTRNSKGELEKIGETGAMTWRDTISLYKEVREALTKEVDGAIHVPTQQQIFDDMEEIIKIRQASLAASAKGPPPPEGEPDPGDQRLQERRNLNEAMRVGELANQEHSAQRAADLREFVQQFEQEDADIRGQLAEIQSALKGLERMPNQAGVKSTHYKTLKKAKLILENKRRALMRARVEREMEFAASSKGEG
jgi:hypothetical protein